MKLDESRVGAVATPPAPVVTLMADADRALWDAYVHDHADATFFHRAGWRQIIEQEFGHGTWYLMAQSAGRLRGILPLAQVRSRWFGHTLCSLPFCVYGGIVASDAAAASALDAAAQGLARSLGVDHLEYRQLRPRHPDWPRKTIYATFRRPLLADAHANLLAIPRKQRAMVRKAMASGLRSRIDDDTGRLYRCYAASVHRLGTPVFSRSYFAQLAQVFGDDCEVLTVEHGGEAVSAVMSFRFREQILPYYGGGLPLARQLAANDFMYWEVMRRACEDGCTLFDFGRSKLGTGAYAFKKNWGFVPEPLHYECQLVRGKALRDLQPRNPRLQPLVRAWQLLPQGLANALGPHIVRQLG